MLRPVPFLTTAVCAVAASAALAAPAGATSFSGHCSFSGTVTFGAPVSVVPIVTSHAFAGAGDCSGRLNGRAIQSAPVSIQEVAARGISSCSLNAATGIQAQLAFFPGTADAAKLQLRESTFGAGVITLLFRGASSGIGVGVLTFPVTVPLLEECASGTLKSSPVHQTLNTITALVG